MPRERRNQVVPRGTLPGTRASHLAEEPQRERKKGKPPRSLFLLPSFSITSAHHRLHHHGASQSFSLLRQITSSEPKFTAHTFNQKAERG
ncbi:hypothetical protein FH972_013521 [Carpinus fangiana]|uniref:Uncharacterized protein n=1 Tax=Carpinus fangiana TaxID=176857 RepID=A0A5N6R714_9ROSI|nr:hypothetical protein FH972_013521 [Carpinus fangiana]